MAIFKTGTVTKQDAKSFLEREEGGDYALVMQGQLTIANGQTVGDQYRFFRVKSSDVLVSGNYSSNGNAGVTAVKIGLYKPNGGAAVDDDVFSSNENFSSGARETPFVKANAVGKRVWELLGLSADSDLEYDLTFTIATGTATNNQPISAMMIVKRV